MASFNPDEATYRCPRCGGNLDVRIDFSRAARADLETSRDGSLFRYARLLPVEVPGEGDGPLRSVGGTPLYDAPRIARRLGLRRVWIKDEGRMPTGSLKDRASAIVVQRARAIGAPRILTASTGNAGVALAAMARCAELEAIVLVPENAPKAKLAQLAVFGARVIRVRGSYDDAFALSESAAAAFGWYCRNTGQNPFTVEGKKTVSFEIAEQLSFRAPDRVVVSVGDGNILVGVHKGFRELLALGWIDRMPKILGVQASGSSPIAQAWARGDDVIHEVQTNTLADSIAAGRPADGERALRAVRATGGAFIIVEDAEILAAIPALGDGIAVFAEPAASAAYAGLQKAREQGIVDAAEEVVVLVTGSGLKDVGAAERAVARTSPVIAPSLDELRDALGHD